MNAKEPLPINRPLPHVRVQAQDFDPAAEAAALQSPAAGAVVSFVGLVRDGNNEFPVGQVDLEHYPGMTERSLQDIAQRALDRWPLLGVRLIHRFGTLAPTDRIVLVAVASAHRDDAFDACRFLIDYLKTDAPFWKRERGPKGERWVAAKEGDDQALKKWQSGGKTGKRE